MQGVDYYMADQGQDDADINELDDYLQEFYEDKIENKIIASRKILLLTLDVSNIERLFKHDSIHLTISRVLKEEFKKSTELTIYLLCIFYFYSNYQQFHQVLIQNGVGDSTMKIIEYQIDRFDLRYAEFMALDKKSPETEKQLHKLNYLIAKQDKMFYIALTILLNLAEDFNIEKKMRKRNIVSYLLRLLERNDFHLLIIVLLFLRKLSIFSENKKQMHDEGLVEKLARFFSCGNQILLQLALGVLKNLAFDKDCRIAMEKAGYVNKIVDLLSTPAYRFIAIILLYLLSIEDSIRTSFAYSDYMNMLIKLIVHFPEQHVGKELIALAVNLGANQRNAELLTKEHLKPLVERALKNSDNLLMKFVKNIAIYSINDETNQCLQKYIKHFLKVLMSEQKSYDLKIEIIGLCAQLQLEEKWEEYLTPQFLEFLTEHLMSMDNPEIQDDIILETIQLVAQISNNVTCAEILAKNKMLMIMCSLLIEKGDDDEFITQTLYAIYQFLAHKIGIEYVLNQQEIMITLQNNIQDKNPNVRKINDELLDILREYDHELSEKVKERKYYEFNKEWIQSLQEYEDTNLDEEYYGMDFMGQPYYQQDIREDQLDPKMWDSESEY